VAAGCLSTRPRSIVPTQRGTIADASPPGSALHTGWQSP
jgi:hypothetical protein